MTSPKLRIALTHLLSTVGGGIRLSKLTAQQKKLVKFAARYGYVTETPLPNDWLINRTGKKP
jgi:hypothetical protein